MKEHITISVIIPVFNVSEYLEECVRSVICQTYPYIEIILVDDGSTDGSAEICDSFKNLRDNIHVIHKSNGGLSDARNTGLKVCTGKYVVFLDADDFWNDSEAISVLVKRLQQTDPDVLNYSYTKYYDQTGTQKTYFNEYENMPDNLTHIDTVNYITENGLYIAAAWNKVIRRSLLDEKMQFVSGIYSEDVEWCARLLNFAESMDFICANFYCYRQRSNSITHTINSKKCSDLCNNILGCLRLCENAPEVRKKALLRYTAYQFATFFIVQAQAEFFQEDAIDLLLPHQGILKYHNKNIKLIVLNILCKILGYKRTCKIVRFAYRISAAVSQKTNS